MSWHSEFGHYLTRDEERHDWRFAPLEAAKLNNLPPAFIALAEHAPLIHKAPLGAFSELTSIFLTELLEKVRLPGQSGRPGKRSRYIVADKGYDSDALRHYCTRYGMRPIIPQCRMHRRPKLGPPHQFDRPKYRQRNVVERLFGWLKGKRRLSTRYDKQAMSFKAMVALACIERCMSANPLFITICWLETPLLETQPL